MIKCLIVKGGTLAIMFLIWVPVLNAQVSLAGTFSDHMQKLPGRIASAYLQTESLNLKRCGIAGQLILM